MAATGAPRMADIIGDFREHKLWEELRGNWVIVALHRPPSFGLVWLLARAKVSPDAVSWAGGAVALALPLAAGFVIPAFAGLAVFALGFLFHVLDCVDGGLARLTGQASPAGARLDAVIDMAQWGLLYLAIGILADRQLDTGGVWSALALGAAWMRLFARAVRTVALPQATGSGHTPPSTLADLIVAFFAGLSGALPFLALAGGWLHLSVWALLAYSLLDLADTAFAVRASP